MEKNINKPQEMQKLGYQINQKYSKILVYWKLWAGKTQFAKGFGKWLDINTNIIKSPTYKYINIYENKLLHIDMYRLDNQQSLIEKWILNQINKFQNIIIERPKYTQLYSWKSRTHIHIEKTWTNSRKVKIQN